MVKIKILGIPVSSDEETEIQVSKELKGVCTTFFEYLSIIEKDKEDTEKYSKKDSQKGYNFAHVPTDVIKSICFVLRSNMKYLTPYLLDSVYNILRLESALLEKGITQKLTLEKIKPDFEKIRDASRYTKN